MFTVIDSTGENICTRPPPFMGGGPGTDSACLESKFTDEMCTCGQHREYIMHTMVMCMFFIRPSLFLRRGWHMTPAKINVQNGTESRLT